MNGFIFWVLLITSNYQNLDNLISLPPNSGKLAGRLKPRVRARRKIQNERR
jgi:hypothetical protein